MFWNLWGHGHRVGGTLMLEQACLKGLLIFRLLWRKILVIELVNVKRRGENLWKIDFCIILILNIRMRFLFKNMHLSFNFGWQVKLGNQIDFCKNICSMLMALIIVGLILMIWKILSLDSEIEAFNFIDIILLLFKLPLSYDVIVIFIVVIFVLLLWHVKVSTRW